MQRRDMKWRKPRSGFVKLNWDASLDLGKNGMGMGIVVMDVDGELMLSLCNHVAGVSTPAVVELNVELNWHRVIFKDDALGIIQSINRKSYYWEWHGQIVEDKKLSLFNRDTWSIQYNKKDNNRVAHIIRGR